jgi:hypothetical protein
MDVATHLEFEGYSSINPGNVIAFYALDKVTQENLFGWVKRWITPACCLVLHYRGICALCFFVGMIL